MTQTPCLAAVATGLHADYTTVLLFLLFGIFFGNLALGIARRRARASPAARRK